MTTWTDHTADRPISLTAPSGIDRAAHHRLDEAWLAAAWSHPTTRCFVVSGGQVLIDETADGRTELVMTPSFEAPLTEAHRYFHTEQKACMFPVGSWYTGRAFVPPDKGGQPKDFELGLLNYPLMKDGKGHGEKYLGVAGSLAVAAKS